MLGSLRRRRYNSRAEYYEKLSSAAAAFGNVASALAHLEATGMAQMRHGPHPRHRTLEVFPTGDGERDFAKIQAAIDIASPGDRVLLKPGVFRSSGALWIWKDLVIEGEGGAVIEGTTNHGGKTIADPAINGGFIVIGGASAEIRNINFRLLYFAVASHGGLGNLVFEDNTCEDVYHSVYVTASREAPASVSARCNRILVSSLDHHSSRCRFNFYEENHLFGFYCSGNVKAVLEANHLEVRELAGAQQFHAIGVFCADGGSALVRDNFIKGWHSAVSVHDSRSPILFGNSIHGLCQDAEFSPIGIFLRNCDDPAVCSNRIMNRGLGPGTIGIALAGTKRGRVLDNRLELAKDAEAGILVFRSDGLLIGQNSIGNKLHCPIGLFGDQSGDVQHNLLFCNSIEGKADIKMCYASENTILGRSAQRSSDGNNTVLGYEIEAAGFVPAKLDKEDFGRRQRVSDHLGRKLWPQAPEKYVSCSTR